jgi:hypothetical protein
MGAKKRRKPGPKAANLKIEGDWRSAVGRALAKGKPPTDVGRPTRRGEK